MLPFVLVGLGSGLCSTALLVHSLLLPLQWGIVLRDLWAAPPASLPVEVLRATILATLPGSVLAFVVTAAVFGVVGDAKPGMLLVPLPLAAGGSVLLVVWGVAVGRRLSRAGLG